ncbi:MAG: alpha-amylase family glycosyl hydrolase [Micropruina sp.]|uniref:alpha-amylase family glycosyl hydrolase n=1 Tax=Micropruina sp. TaxID=2737536 RepID=UPI0039E34D96
MDWTAHVIWWHCYPLGFVNAEDTAVHQVRHRLGQLTNWLDYLIDLGCNGMLLNPIFASATHGYDTLDHYAIDARLGDDGDFGELMWKAKERGIRVLLDGVFNHLGREHPVVQRALAAGPGTPDGDWLRWVDGHPRVFEGHEPLVELDFGNPAVQDFVVDIMCHWLDRGIDGWRLDAAYAPGAAAWRPIVERVKAAHPDCWLLGEVIHGDKDEFVAESGLDSVTQYELWHAIWQSMNQGNLWNLDWGLQRHRRFCARFRPQIFISNHDVTRISSKLDDRRHVAHAAVLLTMLPGVPSIYAGDEHRFEGVKLDQAGGDDAVRPPFPATPDGLLPFGADTFELYRTLIGLRRQHAWVVDAVVTTRDLTNESVVVVVAGPDEVIELGLNISDGVGPMPEGALLLASEGCAETVPPHGWAIAVRPRNDDDAEYLVRTPR